MYEGKATSIQDTIYQLLYPRTLLANRSSTNFTSCVFPKQSQDWWRPFSVPSSWKETNRFRPMTMPGMIFLRPICLLRYPYDRILQSWFAYFSPSFITCRAVRPPSSKSERRLDTYKVSTCEGQVLSLKVQHVSPWWMPSAIATCSPCMSHDTSEWLPDLY